MTAAPVAPAAVLSKRKIQRISLANFETRKIEITGQLMEAATDLGFFTIDNTGISQGQASAAQQCHVKTTRSSLQLDL